MDPATTDRLAMKAQRSLVSTGQLSGGSPKHPIPTIHQLLIRTLGFLCAGHWDAHMHALSATVQCNKGLTEEGSHIIKADVFE